MANSFRSKILVQLQSIRSGAIPEKDWESTFAQMVSQLDAASNPAKPEIKGAKKGAQAGMLLFDECFVCDRSTL